jgi:hypothetical protein
MTRCEFLPVSSIWLPCFARVSAMSKYVCICQYDYVYYVYMYALLLSTYLSA